jgi:L-lactate dehydrogenase
MPFSRKVAIVGCGNVGSTTAFALATQGLVSELTLIDIKTKKSEGDAIDIEDAVANLPVQLTVRANDWDAAAASDIVILSAGPLPNPNQSRLDTLDDAKKIVAEVVPLLVRKGFAGIFLDITNPCDVVTHDIYRTSGFPANRVFGTGTGLDSARFRKIIAKLAGVAPRSVEGYTLGEHGDSQMIPWSHVRVGGKPFDTAGLDLADLLHQVTYGGWEVLLRKGATYYGIASVAADVVRAVFNDEKRILPVSALLDGEYGERGIHIGVPAVIGAGGVERVIELELPDDELAAFAKSAGVIRSYVAKLR